MKMFYEVRNAPVHSVLLMSTREIAVNFPRRDIQLGLCSRCGFIGNTIFDPSVHSYSKDYEETQGYSAVFREFHRNLALTLIDDFDLHGKNIIEIGCGKGEFLALLCELGPNRGVGFDPAFVSERNPVKSESDVKFVNDFYSEKYADVQGDFICCKMTLEHIPDTYNFVSTVRRSIGARANCTVFFQIPDMNRVLTDLAFWDIYYEHCSYFTADSLRYLFEICGYKILEISTAYNGQYLTITATPAETRYGFQARYSTPAATERTVEEFAIRCQALIDQWRDKIAVLARSGKKIVIWGSGSKGVAFLTAMQGSASIDYVVDINPHRQRKFMAGTGQEIVSPNFLESYRPDIVIAMNAIYRGEIQSELDRMNLDAMLLSA